MDAPNPTENEKDIEEELNVSGEKKQSNETTDKIKPEEKEEKDEEKPQTNEENQISNQKMMIYAAVALGLLILIIGVFTFMKGDSEETNLSSNNPSDSAVSTTNSPSAEPTVEVEYTPEPSVTPTVTNTPEPARFEYQNYEDDYLAFDYPDSWQVENEASDSISLFYNQFATTNGVSYLSISDNASTNFFSFSPVFGGDEFQTFTYNPETDTLEDYIGAPFVTPAQPSSKGVEVKGIAGTELFTLKMPSIDLVTLASQNDQGDYYSVDYGVIVNDGFEFLGIFDIEDEGRFPNSKWVRLNCQGEEIVLTRCVNFVHDFFGGVEQRFTQNPTVIDLEREVIFNISSNYDDDSARKYQVAYSAPESNVSHNASQDYRVFFYGELMQLDLILSDDNNPLDYINKDPEGESGINLKNINTESDEVYYYEYSNSGGKERYRYGTFYDSFSDTCDYDESTAPDYAGCGTETFFFNGIDDGFKFECKFNSSDKKQALQQCDALIDSITITKL